MEACHGLIEYFGPKLSSFVDFGLGILKNFCIQKMDHMMYVKEVFMENARFLYHTTKSFKLLSQLIGIYLNHIS